jgi:hypothetical protein
MPTRTGADVPGSEAAHGGQRSRLRFLRIVCPENHPLIEVVPGLDGPVLLLKNAALMDKARRPMRLTDLTALGPDAAVRCRCDCSDHDVYGSWINHMLNAGTVRVVWDGPSGR